MSLTRYLSVAGLLLVLGCTGGQSPVAADAPSAVPADYFSPNNPELQKYHKARMNPAITADVVKEKVRERVRQGTISEIQAEVKDVKWATENTKVELDRLYTPDSPIWYVTIKGDIPAPDPEVPIRYKAGRFLVEPELGMVVSTLLNEPEMLQEE